MKVASVYSSSLCSGICISSLAFWFDQKSCRKDIERAQKCCLKLLCLFHTMRLY